MLKQETVLESMRMSFPSWSDIRKRTKKSTGGRLLTAYSNEFDTIQQAIDEYQKLFFLVSYKDHEDDVIDYLYLAFVGGNENLDFAITEPECKITTYPSEFFDNLDTMCLYQAGYVLIHEKLLGDRKTIKYLADGYEYESKCYYEHIWNAFDEFALFAGLERQEGEKNLSLATRTYNVFKQFPNASDQGLKNAIVNTVKTVRDLNPEAIEILPIDKDTLDMSNPEVAQIYEDFLQYNKDVFRAKVWNRSLWEHKFQKTDFIPHKWDEEMEITQDGVGSRDSLKIDYIKKLNQNDATNVRVDAYRKDFETIRQYIGKSNIEASLQLTLTKYSDDVKPKNVTVKIHAYDAMKLDNPSNIVIHEMQRCSGEATFYVDDIATQLHNVVRQENGKLTPGTKYQLKFTPKSAFSDMSISKCQLTDGTVKKDLLKENSNFKFKKGVLRNVKVLAHVDTMAELSYVDNIVSAGTGFTVGPNKDNGTFGFDVTGMGGQMVNYDVSCRPIDISDSKYVSVNDGFKLDSDRRGYTNSSSSSLGYIDIGGNDDYKMSCNSYSFELAEASDPSKQGAIEVTVIANGKTTTTVYTQPCTVSETFKSNTETHIIIRKFGLYPVQVRKIRIASYDIDMSLSDGTKLDAIGNIVRLPKNVDGKLLKVHIKPHTSSYPTVKYVHVGLSLTGSRYEVDFTTSSGGNPILNIDTDCDVTLYKVSSSGTKTVVGSDKGYSTKASFINTSTSQGQIVINTEDFTTITGSSPEIHKKFQGTAQSYIILEPGESITTIVISGDISKTLSTQSLTSILSNNDYANKEYYVTSGYVGAMFVKDTSNGSTSRVTIDRDKLNPSADTFRVSGLPESVNVKYANKAGDSKISNILNSDPFDEMYLIYDKSVEHVAYNRVTMITELRTGIEIVNTFDPLMSSNNMEVYEIETPKNSDDHIEFGTSKSFWSLGVDPLGYSILTVMEQKNAETWLLEINHINNKYILDNEIPLDERYLVDGIYHALAEYIVEPEKGLKIDYTHSDEEETITANKTASKLFFSNLKNVKLYLNGTQITKGFTIMEKEGLIIWDDASYNNKKIKVTYRVLIPDSITYTEEFADKLYSLVSFRAEAYKHVGTKEFENLVNGDVVNIDIADVDRFITKCSNPCFQSIINNGKLFVSQVREEEKLAIHNGYIYDAGLEFWYFNDKYDDDVDKMKNVELHDVTRLADKWLFHMAAKNYLPYSTMATSVMSKLCAIDFTRRLPTPISEFYHLTACDSYNLWYFIDMKGEIVRSLNGYGIRFKTTETVGYAAAEITRFVKKGNIFSLYAKGDIKVFFVKETKMGKLSFSKSVCFDAKNAKPLNKTGDFRYFIMDKEPEEYTRYYLYIQGKDGQIDDMVSMPYISVAEMIASHKKNIDYLGYNIQESLPVDYEYDIEFERSGCKYDDLQCNSQTWELSTSSSIEYGLTLINNSIMDKCYLEGAIHKKGRIILATDYAKVKTRSFYVGNRSSVYELCIKVNDIAVGKYRDFDVKVYGSNAENGAYILLAEGKKLNTLSIPAKRLKSYIYIEVTGKKNNVIYSIETYARYAERDGAAKLVPIPKTSGELLTKIYDVGTSADYRFDGMDMTVIEGTEKDVECYIRGARENDVALVFTDWKKYDAEANDLNQIVLKDYKLFQFKVALKSKDVTIKINKFKLTVV